MPLVTIVEDYVIAAMREAVVQRFDNGTVAAAVPGCAGVIASGDNETELTIDLFRRLEEWVRFCIAHSYQIPVFGGIDLNTEDGRRLAAYHAPQGRAGANATFIDNEDEIEATLRPWDDEDGVAV